MRLAITQNKIYLHPTYIYIENTRWKMKIKIKDFRVNIVAKVQVLKSTQMDKKHAQFNDCFPLILLLNSCAAISLFHPLQMLQSLIYRTNVSSAHKEHL